MKKTTSVLILFLLSNAVNAQVKLATGSDSLSYALGFSIANNLKQGGFEKLDYSLITKGMDAYNKGDKSIMDENSSMTVINAAMQKIQEKKMAEQKIVAEKNLAEGKKFLEENKKKKGVTTTASGLQYEVIKLGTGPKPVDGDNVTTHYHGTLIDGTVFDSSVQRGEPVQFPINGVIAGWTEALKLMPVGSKYKLFLAPDLAYGEQKVGEVIQPNSTLIFEVELISIDKPKEEGK